MTPITKAAQDAIEAFEAMTKGNERDSDGAWGRIVMPSNAALEKADKAAEALRAALQDKAGEVLGDEVGRSGHYFQFERGEWVKNGDEPTKFWPASGLHYVGRLTKDQREGLDKLIRDYLDGAKPAPVVPDGWRIEMAPQWSETRLRVMPPGEPHYLLLEPDSMNESSGVLYALCRAMLAASQQKGGSAG